MEILERIFLYDKNAPLLFTQYFFWAFFTVFFGIYLLFYKRIALRNIYLLVFSLFFYYKAGGYYFSLLIFSTFVDYFIGSAIFKSDNQKHRKIYVTLSVVINLSLLAYFKYTYFFTDVFNQVAQTDYIVTNYLAAAMNAIFGMQLEIHDIILPVGISFYTFQTISYSVDIYRKKVNPVKNIWDFGFYVSFFPQLVAGPIVRAADFVPQIYKKYQVSKEEFGSAIFLILNGLAKKILISDYISINFVDRVFADPLNYSGFENLMASYGYAIQIYADFSGYTDIAIGVALLLGFRLPLNFDSPYKAENITDFWRRWHISLSSWLKDYLYIPLGGNRNGKTRTYINLMLTMLLGGLWHGAALRFVIWGGLHGIGLAFHKIWMKNVKIAKSKNKIWRFFSIFISFHFVVFAWIFFRMKGTVDEFGHEYFFDLQGVNNMLIQIFGYFQPELIPDMIYSYRWVFSAIFVGFLVHWLPSSWKNFLKQTFIDLPLVFKILIVFIATLIFYQAKSSDIQPFIYFQF